MNIRPEEVSNIIRTEIENYKKSLDIKTSGSVLEVGDGIARIYGLSNAKAGELLEFTNGIMGMVLNLEENNVGAVILGDFSQIKEGDEVKATGRIVSVPAGEGFLGRVVNALGDPIDGKGEIEAVWNHFFLYPYIKERLLESFPENLYLNLYKQELNQ